MSVISVASFSDTGEVYPYPALPIYEESTAAFCLPQLFEKREPNITPPGRCYIACRIIRIIRPAKLSHDAGCRGHFGREGKGFSRAEVSKAQGC
jgi:hypothetical protein